MKFIPHTVLRTHRPVYDPAIKLQILVNSFVIFNSYVQTKEPVTVKCTELEFIKVNPIAVLLGLRY
jgi:hypothetical protein